MDIGSLLRSTKGRLFRLGQNNEIYVALVGTWHSDPCKDCTPSSLFLELIQLGLSIKKPSLKKAALLRVWGKNYPLNEIMWFSFLKKKKTKHHCRSTLPSFSVKSSTFLYPRSEKSNFSFFSFPSDSSQSLSVFVVTLWIFPLFLQSCPLFSSGWLLSLAAHCDCLPQRALLSLFLLYITLLLFPSLNFDKVSKLPNKHIKKIFC